MITKANGGARTEISETLHRWLTGFAFSVLLTTNIVGQDLPAVHTPENVWYFWQSTPVGQEAEILTLFSSRPHHLGSNGKPISVPVLAVLRDTLGDPNHETDRLRYIWLLCSPRPSVKQELVSAIPFFYWKIRWGAAEKKILAKPVIDLGHPTHSLQRNLWRKAIARGASLLSELEVRPLIRQYLTNHSDHARVRAEQALSMVRHAPHSERKEPITNAEFDTIIARLTLSKETFGGLISDPNLLETARLIESRRESSRLRNLELLRSSADRVGLYFEPLNLTDPSLAEEGARYGLLWLPLHGTNTSPGASVDKTWQLLQISDPHQDRHLAGMSAYAQIRSLDQDRRLLPLGQRGVSTVKLIPVAMYSLTYPRVPLLLIDFFHPSRTRRRELNQRLFNDASAATLYISWIPRLGFNGALAIYDYVKNRQGFAVNEQQRLDSYSEARLDVALGCCLDSDFRSDAQDRLDRITLNPLDSSVDEEIASANTSYSVLMEQANSSGELLRQLDKDRRQEIAALHPSNMTTFCQRLFHHLSLGRYTPRTPVGPDTIESTKRIRKLQNLMSFLTQVTDKGTAPEVSYDASDVELAIQQLSTLTITTRPAVRQAFLKLVQQLLILSRHDGIREQCSRTLALKPTKQTARNEPITAAAQPVLATQ